MPSYATRGADDARETRRDWTAFVVAWILYSLLTYRFWYNVDDAFISFRYAKNWAMGYGLRYNATQRKLLYPYTR